MDYFIRRADKSEFKGAPTHGDEVMKEQEAAFVIVGKAGRPDGEGYGAYTYFKDIPFPRKCVYDPDFCAYANIVKRNTLGWLRVFATKKVTVPAQIFGALPGKVQSKIWAKIKNKYKSILQRKILLSFAEDFLYEWWRMGEFTLRPAMWKDKKRYCNMVRELAKFIQIFLTELGITRIVDILNEQKTDYHHTPLAELVGEVFGCVMENDDSYRYRAQDVFGIINKQWLLDDPGKELNRVLVIYEKREHTYMEGKFDGIAKILIVALKNHSVKEAFCTAVQQADFTKLALDKADKYWAFKKAGYDFCGMNNQQKEFHLNQIHGFWDPPSVLFK